MLKTAMIGAVAALFALLVELLTWWLRAAETGRPCRRKPALECW